MILILGKHDQCNKEYVWQVPPWLDVHKGDPMLVETMRGLDIATATSNIIECQDGFEVAARFGAYEPIKSVVAYCPPALAKYVRNKALRDAARRIREDMTDCATLLF